MANKNTTYENIHILRERYYANASGKDALLKLISESEVAEQVYNSNAIENSTLTLKETEKILLEIDLDRFINERELFEAKNLARVISYIQNKAITTPLDLDKILLLHKMLLSNIRDDIAGRFRQGEEFVRVANHIATPPSEIEAELKEMLAQYQATKHVHIVTRIAKLHLAFENTHPFVDGNGRIGRVLNNYLLIQEGYVPINIKFLDRKEYYNAFKEFDETGGSKIMETIVSRAISNSYHKRLAYLENKRIITLSDYAKQRKISHSNLLNKAKRQTIEAFQENNNWKIGIERKLKN